jgi:serine phosphatase RsbU (regulator of sigma subunit)
VQLQKNDCIYLFTDGFADQFGGPSGKKFKYAQFKSLLKSSWGDPLYKQEKLINEAFDSWKGALEQIDDVCVIGLRI